MTHDILNAIQDAGFVAIEILTDFLVMTPLQAKNGDFVLCEVIHILNLTYRGPSETPPRQATGNNRIEKRTNSNLHLKG